MSGNFWIEATPKVCLEFQADLSALADGELAADAAARAAAHLDVCSGCHDFFDDARVLVAVHRDLADPEGLADRLRTLTGREFVDAIEARDLVTRLAGIFYQLGKAYALAATDATWCNEVFEPAVEVERARTMGRGFVDGVLASGRARGGTDWSGARHLFNGRLARVADPLDKAERLLEEALSVDPDHGDARIWRAFLNTHRGRRARAVEDLRFVFDTSLDEVQRGHAAMQLGKLFGFEGDHRRAALFFRWTTLVGLPRIDARFALARYNLAVCEVHLGRTQRAVASLRALLDERPDQSARVAELLSDSSPELRRAMESLDGFAEALVSTCPELFLAVPTTLRDDLPPSEPSADEVTPC